MILLRSPLYELAQLEEEDTDDGEEQESNDPEWN